MKKALVVALAMAVFAGVGYANVLNVPFFFDDSTAGGGNSAFIGIKNTTTSDVTISLFYRDGQGNNRTPGPAPRGVDGEYPDANTAGDNTYVLPANASRSWRPVTEGGGEGVSSSIPDMVGFRIGTSDDGFLNPPNGSVEIRWEGGDATDIQGRIVQIVGDVVDPDSQSAYLLPTGKAAQ